MLEELKQTLYGLIVGAVVATAVTWYEVADYKDNQFKTYQVEEQRKASDTLLAETQKVAAKQLEINQLQMEIEKKNVEQTQERAALDARYRKLVADGLRLRDPGKQSRSCTTSINPQPTAICDGQTTQELSQSATEFLLSEASRADGIVEQLGLCQTYITDLQKQFAK